MLPSSTVENYLKAIYQHQMRLADTSLVPMGQLAAALSVAPGTATTMVKTLAESGLVRYEPYAGVRLTPAGRRLASMVLRRHRLIELFLVQVMGMDWTDVHEEAEQLEHVVSDRLIERMDQMLGRPAVDPHGDPIPDPEGTLTHPAYQDLLTCPLQTPVVVQRVADQDAGFLRFIESSDLKPGQSIQIEARDPAADAVQIRAKDNRLITLGTRAASKVLVRAMQIVALVLTLGGVAQAQTADSPGGNRASRPFEITDNSFLVEEAFNQEPGIFQNIFTFVRIDSRDWEAGFTQEWPLLSQAHQFSFTIPPAVRINGASGPGDLTLNYRFQALTEGPGRPAFSPRLSLITPTGDHESGRGAGVVGLQVNLPFSKQTGDVYWHWNAGATYLPGVEGPADTEADLFTPHLAGSAILRAWPMVHLMLESVLAFEEDFEEGGSLAREALFTIAPGLRAGWNLGDHQVVVGFAVPTIVGAGNPETTVLTYLSYELPFRR
jgi:DtxR family Mn-dependent transcriptional regulator